MAKVEKRKAVLVGGVLEHFSSNLLATMMSMCSAHSQLQNHPTDSVVQGQKFQGCTQHNAFPFVPTQDPTNQQNTEAAGGISGYHDLGDEVRIPVDI